MNYGNILNLLTYFSVFLALSACGKDEDKEKTGETNKDSTSNPLSKRVNLRVDDHPDALSISAAENLFIIHYIDGTNALDPAAGRMMIYITKDGASKSCNISFEVDANKNGIFEKGDALVCKEESPNEYGQEQVGKPFSVGVAQRQPDGVNHNVWSGEWAAK